MASALANIAALIDSGGRITIGEVKPIACAAIAHTGRTTLVMIRRETGEPFETLLNRFDEAIGVAVQTGTAIDQINNTPR